MSKFSDIYARFCRLSCDVWRHLLSVGKLFWNSNTAITLYRLLLVYVVLMLTRLAFYLYNSDVIGAIESGEIWELFCGSLLFDTASMLYVNAIFILFSLIPLHYRERGWWQKSLFWYYLIANALLIVVINLGDAIYFHYAQKRFDAQEFFFAENSNTPLLMLRFMIENPLILLWGIALITLLWFGYRRKREVRPIFAGAWYYVSGSIVFLLAVILSIGGIRGGFTRMTRPITLSNAALYTAEPAKMSMIMSNPFCIIRTLGTVDKYPTYFDSETLATIYSPEHFPQPCQEGHTAPFKGRNVVLFVMESFSAEHSALLCPDIYQGKSHQGFTPFMDSLMQEGYTFYNMYANGKKSIEALPAVWSSIPSFKSPFANMSQAVADQCALPEILAGEGYTTHFFCGSDHGSMGFGAYARMAGIEHLYSRQSYIDRRGRDDFDGYWGIWDEPFFDYMGEVLSEQKQPFFSTIFTLSSHHPFVVPSRYAGKLPQGYTPNHKCVSYVDGALRKFFEKYRSEPWFRNTLFVFVADHVSSEKYAARTKVSPGDYHIMGFMYAPDSDFQGEHHGVVSQIDIMPTLLGLLGNEKPYFAFGRDIFGEMERMAISVNYDVGCFQAITDEYMIRFDEQRVIGVYDREDRLSKDNLVGKVDVSAIERQLKGFIQSYGERISSRNYKVTGKPLQLPDTLSVRPIVDSLPSTIE